MNHCFVNQFHIFLSLLVSFPVLHKTKSLNEFKLIRQRGRADFNSENQPSENVENMFKMYDINEVEDESAYFLFKKIEQEDSIV